MYKCAVKTKSVAGSWGLILSLFLHQHLQGETSTMAFEKRERGLAGRITRQFPASAQVTTILGNGWGA